MNYDPNNPLGNIHKTENPFEPYEYPQAKVRYLSKEEFSQWLKGEEL